MDGVLALLHPKEAACGRYGAQHDRQRSRPQDRRHCSRIQPTSLVWLVHVEPGKLGWEKERERGRKTANATSMTVL